MVTALNPLITDPPTRSLTICTPAPGVKDAPRRWRDGLRPPSTPHTDEHPGWLSGRRLSPGHPAIRSGDTRLAE